MSSTPHSVAVLMGGASAEAEVSRNSATQVSQALQSMGHHTHAIELDSACASKLIELRPDAVFPALHGPPGEDGTVQGLLAMLGLPYIGSDVRGSALAMDKAVAKHIFAHQDLPVADDMVITSKMAAHSTSDHLHSSYLQEQAAQITSRLGAAIVIKPLSQGSAIGVTPMPNGGDVAAALGHALQFGDCLVEPYVMGKEITVGVLEVGDELIPHPVIEIVTASEQWYDYENRYTPGQSKHIMPATLPKTLSDELQAIALTAHQALGLADLSRADFIVADSGAITLLEVNTLPGMTPTSLYPEGAAAIGYAFGELVDHLVQRAVARGPRLEVRPA